MTSFFTDFGIGPISTQTQPYDFSAGSTPVSCAVFIGDGYSTNNYCRLDACVGDNCNVPKAFSVVHSGDKVCTTAPTDTYNIGCNPDAPEDIRNECVEMFQAAITEKSNTVSDGIAFKVNFFFNNTTPTEVECVKYGAGKMPQGLNLYDNVSCTALLNNGEYYDIYAADTGGSPINSLQTKARTIERDNEEPTMEPLKYYTDNSLTTEVTAGTWYNKPVVAVVVCNDTPRGESAACSCAPRVVTTPASEGAEWSVGIPHGSLDIGADLLRYTRAINATLPASQSIGVIDTAGNTSTVQSLTFSLDTKAPTVAVTATGTGVIKTLTLNASDTASKIWKNRTTVTNAEPNTNGIMYRI